ncbi:hypothetical protein AVEN_64161-1 [Araneus ventricosus]|uniref:Uncharacterized protein n=1 Tax=Araneus ventricosus TaxID=182803 RepID=A0A4Y2BXF0_ARAVE|nr:hypothetical protein AVEN_64161-1 [Araneus ventricosus]
MRPGNCPWRQSWNVKGRKKNGLIDMRAPAKTENIFLSFWCPLFSFSVKANQGDRPDIPGRTPWIHPQEHWRISAQVLEATASCLETPGWASNLFEKHHSAKPRANL